MERIKQFWNLVEEVNRAWPNCPNTFDLEPYLLTVLEFVKSAPDLRQELGQCFIEIVNEGKAPTDLLEFCMRELQWPEVREAVEHRIVTSSAWRIKTPMSHVLKVYDAEWEDADLWHYYGG